jgi:predicted nucleotidyltransferase
LCSDILQTIPMGLADRLWGLDKKHQDASEIKEDIDTIIGDLAKIDQRISVYLFGSFAKELGTVGSDLDIAVVLPNDIDKKVFRKEFYRTKSRLSRPVDFIFFNEDRFNNPQIDDNFVYEIRQTGIRIYPREQAW